MDNYFKISNYRNEEPELKLNKKSAEKLSLSEGSFYINFGLVRVNAHVILSDKTEDGQISLSDSLKNLLYLPEYLLIEINVKENEVILGPCMGLLLESEDKGNTKSKLKKRLMYAGKYAELHGAVIIFALDKVKRGSNLIEGYCYNPKTDSFEKGIYPFPTAIYRTIGLSKDWKRYFASVIGDRLFNNRYFNKWQMYEWFSKDDYGAYMPYTVLYKSYEDLLNLLNAYGKIYVKPILGLRGKGIVQVTKDDDTVVFKYRNNQINSKDILKNHNQIIDYIKLKFDNGRYLMQQALNLVKLDGSVVDFRCVMQKNVKGKWECKAVIGRIGEKDSIVSNISSGGAAMRAEDILAKLNLPKLLQSQIEALALDLCSRLDGFGINCGMLGLDIGVDTDNKLWLIEINNRDPDPTIALDINDRDLYKELKSGILDYAKFLSGF